MIRLLLFAAALTAAGVCVLAWPALAEARYRRRVDRRQVVLDEEIQQNARDNYRLLERSIRAIQQVLDDDADLPSMSTARRGVLADIVSEFNQQPKGIR